MSDKASSCDSSDFSDGYPTTTTISTVALQAGNARIVLAVLRCGSWIRVRIQRMEPDLYDIGGNADEARSLHEIHQHLCTKLASKQEQISELLSKADDLVTQQTSDNQSQVYAAMAESLNRAWRDLLGILTQRGRLLDLAMECFNSAENVIQQAERVEHLCITGSWGHDVSSVRQLIELLSKYPNRIKSSIIRSLKVRVPGLKQTMNELRTNYNEKIRTSNLRSQLGVTTQSYLDELDLTSTAAASVTGKMREVDEGITRCRDLLNQHKELNIKIQKREETEFRLNELSMWLSQRIHRSLVEYGRYGTTVEQVADFGDVHRRLQRELQSREPDLEELRIAIGRLSPPAGRSSAQDRLNELSSCWTRYRQIIQLRLELANQFSSLLKSIRENDVHFNSIIQKMNEADKITTSSDFHPSWIQVGTGDTQQIAERIRRELNITTSSLEEEQIVIRQFINHLDESITSSLSRMSRTPLPSQPHELSEVLRVHHNERNEIDHLTLNLKTVAQQLGSMIGAQPDDHDHNGQSWRFIEVPNKFTTGLPLSSMGKRLRSEMCIQLAGLETRWKAWDKAWTLRSIQLERRSTHFGQLTTIEEIEAEIVSAERKLQQIMGMVSLTTPLSQVQMADKDLSQIEATIPVLHSRIRSSAPDMKLQLIQGEPTPTEYTGTNIDLLNVSKRHEQLEIRLTTFTEETVRCRTEINLTLRLLNAVDTAQKALSQITFNLNRVKNQLPEITSENRYQIEEIRFDISEQINRGRVLADTHIPILEQLSIQYPRPMEAKQFIQPIVNEFQSSINNLTQLSDEIRVRTEQCINLQRLQPTHIYDDQIKATTVKMPTKAKPPIIIKPLENITIEEGKKIIMETIFDSGLPPDANPYDTNQLQVTWYKDGIPVVTPDYEVNLTENTASLKISETIKDNAIFTCYISTPYGKAETKCTLTIIDTKSPIPINESLVQPTKNVKEQKPIRELGDPPEFIKIEIPQCRMMNHSGLYLCRATNPYGECSTTCQVDIKPAQPPVIIQPLQNVNLKVGDRCKLTVQYKSELPVEVEWYHNDVPIQGEVGRRRITMELNNMVSLHLLMASDLEDGKYTCTVRNAAGSATTYCNVTVQPTDARESLLPSQVTLRPTAPRRRRDLQSDVDEVFEPVKIPRIVQSPTRVTEERVIPVSAVKGAYPYTSPKYSQRAVSVPPTTTASVPLRIQTNVRGSRPVSDYGRPPQFILPLQNAGVNETEKIKLECQITGIPEPKVTWLKNGIPLAKSNSYTIKEIGQYHCLIFYDVFLDDQGEYTCVAENPYGQAFSSCRMDVERNEPTLVKPLPPSLSVVEGGSVELTCQFTGRPLPSIVWLKDGKQPQSSTNFQTFQDSGFARLYIPKVEKDRTGIYEAVATNPLGSCSTTVYMEILPSIRTSIDLLPTISPVMSGSSPEFTRIFKDVYIESERLEEVVLECSVVGVPTPVVYWTHNGIIIRPDDQRYAIGQGPGPNDHCLIIRRPGPESSGRYQAIAENLHGRVTLDVIVEVPIPPEFVRPLANVVADEGACVVIEGLVNGTPQPKISWYRSGRQLSDGPDFRLDYTNNRVRLTLSEAFPDDAGEYTCEAENIAGRAQSTANLIVRGRLMTPRFIKGLENQVIYERESVRLIVKVDGYPPPTVTWTRDGHEITSSPNYILECEGDGIYALNIPEAFFENSGRYAVIAENPAGKCISSGLLTVLEPERPYPRELDKLCLSQLTVQVEGLKQVHIPSPEPKPYPEKPYFTKTFSPEIEIYEGERLVLTAEACGNPIPFIKWYLNGQPLVDSPDHQQTQVGPPVSDVNELQPHPVIMTGHLIMNELFPEDSGLYTCIAENMAGQAEIMANISVIPKTISDTKKPTIQPPEFIKFPDSPVRVQPDQELILEVEVKGLPLNSLNWYHNGMIVYNNPNQFIQNIPNTGITRLIIQRIQPDDQGEWIVTATNPAGSCSKCLQIIREEPISVLPEPVVHTEYEWKLSHPSMDITDLSHTYQQQTIFIQPEMIPPNFIERFPSELKINEKIPLHINSRVYGQPKPSVQWLKNGKPLYSDERIHYHVLDNGEVRLEITEPTEADSGIYVASAKNPAGEDHCIVNLSVVPLSSVAPTGQPPVFCRGPLPWSPTEAGPIITCPGVLHLQEGQPIRLEAEVIGKPSPVVSWFINGRPITMDKTHKIIPMRANVCSLILDTPVPNIDSGVCSCIATNQFGQAELRFNIHVESKPQAISQAPRFIQKPPTQLTVPLNEEVTLYAVAEGIPQPVLSWHKDGKLFTGTSDGRIQILTNELETTLHIVALQSEDLSTWQCLAANIAGTASARAKISAPIEEKPKEIIRKFSIPKKQPEGLQEITSPNPIIMSPPQSVCINEGENARFTAHIVANPSPIVTWYVNGQPVPSYGVIQAQQPESEEIRYISRFDGLIYYLDMQKCRPEDAGEIVVVAQRSDISPELVNIEPNAVVSASAKLEVIPVIDLRAQLKPIPIEFDGEPAPEVTWTREQVDISNKENYKITTTSTTSQLVISKVLLEDTGNFSVTLRNPAGQACSKSRLTVTQIKVSGKAPEFIPPLIESQIVEAGEPITFECKVTGEPTPQVHWERNGERLPLKDLEHIHVFDAPPFHTLVLCETVPDDSAEYRCVAINAHGQSTCKANVTIQAKSAAIVPPRIIQEPKSVTVMESQPVQLIALIEGIPMPEITWLFNNEIIKPSRYFLPEVRSDGYTILNISSVYPEDTGIYTVRAVNSGGEAQASVEVSISAPLQTAPQFVKPLPTERIEVKEGERVFLEVEVSGEPMPQIDWYLNGQSLQSVSNWKIKTDRYTSQIECNVISMTDGGEILVRATNSVGQTTTQTKVRELYIDEATHTYTLHIHDLNAFDVGEIMVRAENELGVTMCSSVLELEIIDGKIVEPRFIRQPPERIELQPGDSAQLECEVESQPPVTFKWYLNGLQLDQSNKRFKLLEDINRTTLIIPSVQKDILPSEVTIEAAGQTGTKIVTSSILVMTAKTDDLSIPEPPELRFTRQLPSNLSYGEMDETIILDVEIDKPEISSIELPKPTFSWYMNGIDIFLLPPEKKPERYNVTQDNPWHSRLTINKPGTLDSGEITCFVTRLTGTKEEKIYTSCNLELTYQPIQPEEPSKPIISKLEFAPQFIQGLPEKLTPEVGSTVVMDIIVKSNPIPDIQWVISSPITAERFEYFGPEQIDDVTLQYRAILHNYQPDKDDNTMLQIIATSPLGQSTSICHIQPKEQPEIVNVQFAKTLNSQLEVVLDQPIELECSIIPTNIPIEFRWFIKDLEITSEHKPYEIITTDYTSILKIPKITTELIDSTIQVLVVYPYGELKSSCELYTIFESHLPMIEDVITELPTIPEMLTIQSKLIEHEYEFHFIKPIHYEIQQHSNDEYTLELECQLITDQQPASIKWSHEGVELNISDRIEQVYEYESGLAKLIIHNITPQDMGEYTCIATKVQLQPSQVEPIQKTITTSTVVDIEVPETTEVVPTVTEKVLTFLQPVTPNIHTVQDHKDLELECQIQADLKPIEVVWEVDGKELTQSDRNEMIYFEDSGIARLIVHQVIPSDSGEYTCRVQGEVVEAETKQQMTKTISSGSIVTIEAVEKEDNLASPIFVQELTPLNISEGDEIYLTATVKGNPQPVEVIWKHNGNILQPDVTDAVIFYTPETGVCELTISEAFPEDSGIYSVEVQNTLGMAVSQTEVVVLVEVRKEQIVLKSEDQKASIVEDILTVVTDISDDKAVVSTVESVELLKQEVIVNIVQTEKTEMFSPIETLQEIPQAAIYEHIIEETEYEISLEEPLEISDDELLLDEGVTPTHVVVLDVLIPHDSVSIDETSISVEEAGRALSIPSVTEISLHDVSLAAVSDVNVTELKPIDANVLTQEEKQKLPEKEYQIQSNDITGEETSDKQMKNEIQAEQTEMTEVSTKNELEKNKTTKIEEECQAMKKFETDEKQTEKVTYKKITLKETLVEKEKVPVSIVSKGVVEVTDVKSTVGVAEESGSVAEQETLVVEQVAESKETVTVKMEERIVQETLVVEQVAESKETVTVKMEERIVQEVEKESVPETMEWVSEGVGELEESDRQDSAHVVEQPSEVDVAVSETQVEVETVELVSVKEAKVDEAPVESMTVSVSGVTEEKSVVSVTEDFAMEVEQVTLTMDEVPSRMESLTSSAEERVVSEAVPLEETVYDVYETEQVEAVTRPTTDAVASGVVSSTTPSLSDVVSVEEVPSEASY
ncbi:LOW QUALITY PROTEIN: putative hemicentin [Schistosoma mansoni]|nr:LOW QUALITY PROTEIN: putative hemicentin [Schistosoma mansoni]|eukprot:XP_018653756.1 LOW QUALITY PROTEIN: putative hemicentin [Schistosoma mansoni]